MTTFNSNPQSRGHYENLVGIAKQVFGGDYDGNGLVKGIEETLAPYVFGTDTAFLAGRLEGRPDTRSTEHGKRVGELLGRAYILGSTREEAGVTYE